ncbi:hypothetical protein M501DRAFT_934574 [Patellaria atrata CBS 101060]|uniref:Uncharacterized protein n=1 Tax=Patellaria atrata CBS 101060 TaxID=1346257 RepID=A0A9P4VP90_9PEZI|nr:hypothetical protein M501DRAFT_934574 [Patellaria atrata CBS 101060]
MAEAEVHRSVSSIIAAFVNGLDVFKKLRERRRKKKSKHNSTYHHTRVDENSRDELSLSNSLRKGPTDIQRAYEKGVHGAGESYMRGDAIAQSSLAETLLKLNTGLVSIIASFLGHSRHDVDLDYKSLTSLSDISRVEALSSLEQLYKRVSQSKVNLYQLHLSHSHGAATRHGHRGPDLEIAYKHRRKRTSEKPSPSDSKTAIITKFPAKGSSTNQLVMVRPRARRTSSSTSASTSTEASPASTASFPFQAHSPPYPSPHFPQSLIMVSKDRPSSHHRSHTSPAVITIQPPKPHSPEKVQPPPPKSTPVVPGPVAVPRRQDKPTFSMMTFASDSTKLGEIPMRKWTTPYDYEESERLNKEALERGWPLAGTTNNVTKEAKKRGIFRFWRRESNAE